MRLKKYKYKCEKHGFLDKPVERVVWYQSDTNIFPHKWCIYCVNELLDKHCSIIEIDEDEHDS
jgi:hypothetical protein